MQFIDLAAQQNVIADKINARIQGVLNHGKYIMGPEIAELEQDLSDFCGAPLPALGCSNGTDAITLVLMAMDVGPSDAVICPSFTFASTAEVVALRGATPVFVDVLEDTFNMDPESLKAAIAKAKNEGLNAKAVISVDLFGLPADYDAIEAICDESGLKLICDAAQGFGGVYKGRTVGTIGHATTTSFFPAKPLGCYGDGGATFTADEELMAIMKSLRVHGKGTDKYDNTRIGLNARLDTIQAAILLEKLTIFPDEIVARNRVADRYQEALGNLSEVITPIVPEGLISTWAQYTLRVNAEKRDRIMADLKDKGVPSVVYYPKPLHEQTAYRFYPNADELQVAKKLSKEVISLPMHPYLSNEDQDLVCDAVRTATKV
jgi:dTDP-4-amino-4,6-dideoxygalactose transaminase